MFEEQFCGHSFTTRIMFVNIIYVCVYIYIYIYICLNCKRQNTKTYHIYFHVIRTYITTFVYEGLEIYITFDPT